MTMYALKMCCDFKLGSQDATASMGFCRTAVRLDICSPSSSPSLALQVAAVLELSALGRLDQESRCGD